MLSCPESLLGYGVWVFSSIRQYGSDVYSKKIDCLYQIVKNYISVLRRLQAFFSIYLYGEKLSPLLEGSASIPSHLRKENFAQFFFCK